jgi:hypothetical protein
VLHIINSQICCCPCHVQSWSKLNAHQYFFHTEKLLSHILMIFWMLCLMDHCKMVKKVQLYRTRRWKTVWRNNLWAFSFDQDCTLVWFKINGEPAFNRQRCERSDQKTSWRRKDHAPVQRYIFLQDLSKRKHCLYQRLTNFSYEKPMRYRELCAWCMRYKFW